MRPATPAAAPRKLPTLADVWPAWAADTVKLLELETQHEELMGEIARIPARTLVAAPSRRDRPMRDSLSPAAKALLGDEFAPPSPEMEPHPVNLALESPLDFGDAGTNKAADLAVRLNGVREAIEIVRLRLLRSRVSGSRALADAVRGEYAPVAAAVCSALVALATAFRAHDAFVAEIVAGGANPTFLPTLNVEYTGLREFVGDLKSTTDSPLRNVVRSAVESGYFDNRAAVAEWVAPRAVPTPPPGPIADAEAALREAERARAEASKPRRFRVRWNGRVQEVTAGAAPRPAVVSEAAITTTGAG